MGHPEASERPCAAGRKIQKRALSRWRPCRPGRAVSRPWARQMSIRSRPFGSRKTPNFGKISRFSRSGTKRVARELDHRLAGRDLFAVLIPDLHVDHDPARFRGWLLRL